MNNLKKKIIWYCCIDHCEDSRYSLTLSSSYLDIPDDLELYADEIGDHYHSNHDGHEYDWPLTFAVFEKEDGDEVARLLINAEPSIDFSGRFVGNIHQNKLSEFHND